jgi:hypothetical protein
MQGGTSYLFYTVAVVGRGQFKNLSRTSPVQLQDIASFFSL